MSNPRIPYRMADEATPLPAFGGGKILVQLVVNCEHWRFDHPMPRGISTPPQGLKSVPDVPNFAWAEYGMRVGMPRMIRAISERGLTASCSINANVVDVYRSCAERMLGHGWEFIGHGLHQKAVQTEGDEYATIAAALEKIEQFSGTPVLGWLGPGLGESYDTPDYLSRLGIKYLLDWVLDDQPCWMRALDAPLVSVPYNLELNDSVLYAMGNCPTGTFYDRLKRTLATFSQEVACGPKVLSLGLHPHLMGVPHRIGEFGDMLDLLMGHPDVVFVQPRQTYDWFVKAVPTANDIESMAVAAR